MATGGDQLADKVKKVSMESVKSSTAAAPSRPNLPLPKEARARYNSSAHTYKFEPAILAVNHEINVETKDVLDKNDFIVVSYVWPAQENALHVFASMHTALHVFSVPIVTEDQTHVAIFTKHSLRVHIVGPHRKVTAEDSKVQSFVMLLDDLPMFCEMMPWMFFKAASQSQLVSRPDNKPPHEYTILQLQPMFTPTPGVVRTKLQFLSTDAKPMASEPEARLLAPFEKMVSPGQKVSLINNSGLSVDHGALKALMGPKSVWLIAIAWDMLDTIQGIKRSADDLFTQGDFSRACAKYALLATTLDGSVLSRGMPPGQFPMAAALPAVVMGRVILDAITTLGFLYIRSKDYVLAREMMTRTTRNILPFFLARMGMPVSIWTQLKQGLPELLGVGHAESTWVGALLNFTAPDRGKMLRHEEWIATMRCLSAHRPELSERIDMDLALINNITTDTPRRKAYLDGTFALDLLYKASSARQFPPLIFNTPLPAGLQKPQGLRGWQDVEHLEKILKFKPELASVLR